MSLVVQKHVTLFQQVATFDQNQRNIFLVGFLAQILSEQRTTRLVAYVTGSAYNGIHPIIPGSTAVITRNKVVTH